MADMFYDIPESTVTEGRQFSNQPVVEQFDRLQGIEYPCVLITAAQADLKKHLLVTLQNYVNKTGSDVNYPLYLQCEANLTRLGIIDPRSLKRLLQTDMFSSWKISVLADKNTVYTDDLRLAFCYG